MTSSKSPSPWRVELRALLLIGAPMALTQLVQFSINIVDVIMIGRLSAQALAGAALGQVLFYVLFVAAMGPALAVSPMVSQSLGDDPDNVVDSRRSVRMGLWVVTLITMGFSGLFFFVEEFARLIGQPAAAAAMAEPYVLALAPGLPFALSVIVLRNFLAAIERTRVPLAIIVVTTLINAFLNWLLIYGQLGCAAPGIDWRGDSFVTVACAWFLWACCLHQDRACGAAFCTVPAFVAAGLAACPGGAVAGLADHHHNRV